MKPNWRPLRMGYNAGWAARVTEIASRIRRIALTDAQNPGESHHYLA